MLLHAIGVHGLVLLAGTAMPAAGQLRVVALSVAAVGVATGLLAVHAFRQLPWNQLSPPALAVLALCAVALFAAYWTIAGRPAIYYGICGQC